jgi:DNA-binding NtrC family response regulator
MNADRALLARARPQALVADQDDSVRELLLEMFNDLGWDARPVTLPLSHEALLGLRPQLLILELMQAGAAETLNCVMSHGQVLKLTRAQIVITSTDHMFLERMARSEAMKGFQLLAKPFGYDELVGCVRASGPVPRRRALSERALGA